MTITDTRTRWLALIVLCLGDLMIVLDTTIVNVALPSIREDLGFSRDVARVGRERLHCSRSAASCCSAAGSATSSGTGGCSCSGSALFTLASLACGLAHVAGRSSSARARCRGSAARSSRRSRSR